MKTTAFWAGYYGFRSDASEAFIQGYLDEVQRLDQRGQGVACGRGWIPRSKKCSRDKASQTSAEAKARTVEKAKARGKLKGEVKAAKGQKPYVKPKPEPTPEVKPKKERKPRVKKEKEAEVKGSSEFESLIKQRENMPKIKNYNDFKDQALQVITNLNEDEAYSGLVPIHEIRRELGKEISDKQFNDFMLDMMNEDDGGNGKPGLSLEMRTPPNSAGLGSKPDGEPLAVVDPYGRKRYQVAVPRNFTPPKPRRERPRVSMTDVENAKNPTGPPIRNMDEFKAEINKALDNVTDRDRDVLIHEVRAGMRGRVTQNQFNKMLRTMADNDEISAYPGSFDNESPTQERVRGGLYYPETGSTRFYITKARR